MIESCPSRPLTEEDLKRVLRDNLHSDHMLEQRVQSLVQHHVQQPLNCCQTTAVAYALTVLGFPTTPDDLFWTLEVDVDTAVHEGMTLAETHELALRYIRKHRLPVFVEAYHFDAPADVTPDKLWEACWEDGRNGKTDVIVLNFHSGIAHGRERGGGHFSLLAAAIPDSREVVVADVHAMKYGAHWAAPVEQLLSAMANVDEGIGRARGLLRFGLHGHGLTRPIPTLRQANRVIDWLAPPSPYTGAYLQRFIPDRWFSYLGARNMGAMSAVALACCVLGEQAPQVGSMDRIMRALRESYTSHLNRFGDVHQLLEILGSLNARRYIRSSPSLLPLATPLDAGSLAAALGAAGCGSAQVTVLVPFDSNVAYGGAIVASRGTEADLLSHGSRTWGILAAFDPAADRHDLDGVIVAAPHGVTGHGRLWRCSLDSMARAIDAVGCSHLVLLRSDALLDQNTRLSRLLAAIDRSQDGTLDAHALRAALTAEGFDVSAEEALAIIRDASQRGADSLDHTEAIELLVDHLGYHPDHASQGHPRHAALAAFLESHGCVANELGFSTVHLARRTADIHRCVRFYNGVVGWPLYKTIDRAHADGALDRYGSSWASFGAFASFVVSHQAFVPVGQQGHGPWAGLDATPRGLLETSDAAGRIAFADIPMPFVGVLLEPGFFDRQMARITEKDPSLRWLQVDGVDSLLGGGEIASAVVLRDPDGYPLIFFVSTLAGDGYRARFPVTPFVYGTKIKACYPGAPEWAAKRAADDAWIASCPTIAKYRSNPDTRPLLASWLARFVYGHSALEQHKRYYEQVLGCRKLAEKADDQARVVELEYGWDGHFMIVRTDPRYDGILVGVDEQHHDMGGNKGLVPVPHFGVNTGHENFSALRRTVSQRMVQHGVPYDMCVSLSAMGHAPVFNQLDSYHLLFPTDPDSCLSMLCCDPGGNINEIKFYLDFGEMFHGAGSTGIEDIAVDNSMVEGHFPPAVLRMMERRGLRGDRDGVEVLREEQAELVNDGVVPPTGWQSSADAGA